MLLPKNVGFVALMFVRERERERERGFSYGAEEV
jgi:hypothetical protein